MKTQRLLFAIILSLLISATAYAQRDADQVPHKADNEKLFTIKPDDVPKAVKKTLKKPKYWGWKKGEVYRNLSSNHYTIKMGGTRKPKSYSFDETGKPVTTP